MRSLKRLSRNSFVHSARFIPTRFQYWTCPTDETCIAISQKRARCRAHKAVIPIPLYSSAPNLQLLCGFTDTLTSPSIIVDKNIWTENGMFEVCCFDPEFEVDRWSIVEELAWSLHLSWGKHFGGSASVCTVSSTRRCHFRCLRKTIYGSLEFWVWSHTQLATLDLYNLLNTWLLSSESPCLIHNELIYSSIIFWLSLLTWYGHVSAAI